MTSLRRPALLLLAALVVSSACGDQAGSVGESPTSPSTNTTPPPSGVPSIAGSWNGTSDFEQSNNTHSITTLSLAVTQNDRDVQGTIRFTGGGWESWRGTFTGSISGTVDPEFFGVVMLQSDPTTGSGTCVGQMTMGGRATSSAMRWEAATFTMNPNGASQATCPPTVRNIAWIFNR